METKQRLIGAFAAALAVPEDAAIENYEYRAVAGWDSIAHLRLVSEIENTFDIMLDTEDVIGLSSFRKGLEMLARHGIEG